MSPTGSRWTSRGSVGRAGSGARIEIARLPSHPAATVGEALGGGEDYELLATLPDRGRGGGGRTELREGFGVSLSDIGDIIERGPRRERSSPSMRTERNAP